MGNGPRSFPTQINAPGVHDLAWPSLTVGAMLRTLLFPLEHNVKLRWSDSSPFPLRVPVRVHIPTNQPPSPQPFTKPDPCFTDNSSAGITIPKDRTWTAACGP